MFLRMMWVQVMHSVRARRTRERLWSRWWVLVLLVVLCALSLLQVLRAGTPSAVSDSCHGHRTQPLTMEDVGPRKEAARELRNALSNLHLAKELKEPPRADSLLALQRILGLLDPRYVQQEAPTEEVQKGLLVADADRSKWSTLLEACPEQYRGPTYDPPYYSHAFTSECDNQVPEDELVTITLDATGFSPSLLQLLLQDISRYKFVPVVVAVSSDSTGHVAEDFVQVKVVRVTTSTPSPVRWSRLLKNVTTKYVLVGRGIISYSPFSNLQRLLRVLRITPYVAFAGGATRSEHGNWKVACYQSHLELFGLTVREGYSSSTSECMYCDAMDGPFLAMSTSFKDTPIDTKLPADVFFSDWFMRMHNSGSLGLACPDVLFFTSQGQHQPWESRESWAAIAKKWGVTDIHLPEHTDHHFTCLAAGLDCSSPRQQHLAVPPCCLARLGFTLSEVISILEAAYVKVHIADGTVVDGVKGGLQPWVGDVHLAVRNTTQDINQTVAALQSHGFKVTTDWASGEYQVRAFSRNIVIHRRSVDLMLDLPPSQREVSTRLLIGGSWLPAPSNPGLYARGLLGPGSLLHRPLGHAWPPCPVPGHHACLDHLPLDGTVTRLS